MANLIGRVLGQYKIVSLIGKGGMAIVYRAVQPSMGREVAIKVLPPALLKDRTFLERFTHEARIIAQLQHPRILPVYDYGEQDGLPYIVMAYMPAGSLEDRIRAEEWGLPLIEVVRLVAQIAEALDFAHDNGVIHRDFKPANVLLDDRGNTYLADFGIARMAESTAQVTATGLSGSPAYVAPETAARSGPHKSLDLYALGVTLYQMLAGKVPYMAANPMGVLMAHLSEPIPDIRERRPELPAEIQAVVEKGMAKDPADRYQSAAELAADLYLAATTGLGKQIKEDKAPPAAEAVEAPPTGARRRTWMAVAGGAALVILAAGLLLSGVLPARVAVPPTPSPSPTTQPTPTGLPPTATQPVEAAVPVETPTPTAAPTDTPIPTATAFGGGGGRILFESFRDGTGELYLMNTDGSGLVRLTNDAANDTSPVWSPDGLRFAFTSFRDNNQDIFVMDVPGGPGAGGGEPLRITTDPNADIDPAWSPDGRRIAFASNRTGNYDIYAVDVPGDTPADAPRPFRLTDHPANDFGPAWSPDGTRILFYSSRDGDAEICVMNFDGSGVAHLTDNTAQDIDPAWSPDGRRIVFASDVDGDFEIFVMDSDGSNVTRLTDNRVSDTRPTWSWDGQWIAFVTERDGNPELYLMTAEGRLPQRLTEHKASDTSPDWEP
jgi:Tol biopolymer transport system component/tRNA A-37 threonylcarbamoyl transferase component Bud32